MSRRKKDNVITVRLNAGTTALLERLAEDYGMNLSETLRTIIILTYTLQYVPEDVRKNWDEYIEAVKRIAKGL